MTSKSMQGTELGFISTEGGLSCISDDGPQREREMCRLR